MSLHLKPTMSKSRRVFSPGSSGSGHRLADLEKARNERRPQRGRVRLLEAHIWVSPERVNGFLQFCCRLPFSRGEKTPFPASLADLKIGLEALRSRAKPLFQADLFRRSEYRSASLRPPPRCAPFDASPGHQLRRSPGSHAIQRRANDESCAVSSARARPAHRSSDRR